MVEDEARIGQLKLNHESSERYDLLKRLAPGGAENFITKVFCWLLEETDFDDMFLDHLVSKSDKKIPKIANRCNWTTQESFQITTGLIRPDMICRSEDPKTVLVFEHKVWAKLPEYQLEDYQKIEQEVDSEYFSIILITARENSRNQLAACHIFWEEIHAWLSEWIHGVQQEDCVFVVRNFLELLEQKGLGPLEKIGIEQLRELPKAIAREREAHSMKLALERMITSLIDRVVHGPHWQNYADLVPKHETKPKQSTERKSFNWGRYGFYLFGAKDGVNWLPGLFVGILDDNVDHGPSLEDSDSPGPIACVILSVHKEAWGKYETSHQYKDLVEAFHRHWPSENSTEWQIHEEKKNRWHPLMIYKPLHSVLRYGNTGDEQVIMFVKETTKVVKTVFEMPELTNFKQSLS